MQDILIALSDPLRLQAVHILWDGGEHCVCELMARTGASQSRMSRHMQTLKKAGILLDRRDAQWVRYRRNTDLSAELENIVDAVLAADHSVERQVA